MHQLSPAQQEDMIDEVARISVLRTVHSIPEQSETLARLEREGRIAIVGAMYDVVTGDAILQEDHKRLIDVTPPYGFDRNRDAVDTFKQ